MSLYSTGKDPHPETRCKRSHAHDGEGSTCAAHGGHQHEDLPVWGPAGYVRCSAPSSSQSYCLTPLGFANITCQTKSLMRSDLHSLLLDAALFCNVMSFSHRGTRSQTCDVSVVMSNVILKRWTEDLSKHRFKPGDVTSLHNDTGWSGKLYSLTQSSFKIM